MCKENLELVPILDSPLKRTHCKVALNSSQEDDLNFDNDNNCSGFKPYQICLNL
jgi:hypothetical protein